MPRAALKVILPASDYDLAATLTSGQAFRWELTKRGWAGVIGRHWVCLRALGSGSEGVTAEHQRSPTEELGTWATPRGGATCQAAPSSPSPREARAGRGLGRGAPLCSLSCGSLCNSHPSIQPGLEARTAEPVSDWRWLTEYLQSDLDLAQVLATFPDDGPMRAAVGACRGLRLLRQDPWECLASFILSSTKQIVQIRRIVARLCERYGEPVAPGPGSDRAFAFPSAAQLASVAEADLRACGMGFRAPYLLAAARRVADGRCELGGLRRLSLDDARAKLVELPGVGPKIADCVLLFSLGFPSAFPVDVWVMRALRQLYFPRRRVTLPRLRQFAATHFGPCAGYAQQYLFCYVRQKLMRNPKAEGRNPKAEGRTLTPRPSTHALGHSSFVIRHFPPPLAPRP